MAIIDLYSTRQKILRGEVPDVFTYDVVPRPLRVQAMQIMEETLGDSHAYFDTGTPMVSYAYNFLVKALRREYGDIELPGSTRYDYQKGDACLELMNFFMAVEDNEKAIDVIEMAFRAIDAGTRKWDYLQSKKASENADAAIAELNIRFKQHGLGFYFVEGRVLRVDSQLLHAEVVIPAITLLKDSAYAGAQQEFMAAHNHYRHGRTKEALSDCLKALESTMKAISDKRGWTYPSNATANALITACVNNALIPLFWQSHFTALRTTLESGVPTGRNKLSGHGQGSAVSEVPMYIASYMLHLTATSIVFLAESEKAMA